MEKACSDKLIRDEHTLNVETAFQAPETGYLAQREKEALSPIDGLLGQIGQTQDVKLKGAIFWGNMISQKTQNRDYSTNPGTCSLKEVSS